MKRIPFIFVVLLACPLVGFRAQDGGTAATAHRPIARSQQEYLDYRTAASSATGSALERAAEDFARKYPKSELRSLLYLRSLHEYQRENDSAGVFSAGEDVLALDPNNTLALVLTATVLADGLTADDPDRNKKIATINERTGRALGLLEAGIAAPAGDAPNLTALYRATLQATAYSALGIMKLKTGDDAGAEKDLRTGATLAELRPDPYIWYHLALAQDRRKKYRSAMYSVEQAMQLASSNPQLQKLAEAEHDRLNSKLANPSPETQGTNQNKDAPDGSGGTQPPQ
jgi:tetratricopeptide (TPR) repeat protein